MRPYFSERNGLIQRKYTQEQLIQLFIHVHGQFKQKRYFEGLYGKRNDWGQMEYGLAGKDIESFSLKQLGEPLMPIREEKITYDYQVFSLIELLYGYVSNPDEEFDIFSNKEKEEFRTEVNEILAYYDKGYELCKDGYVREKISSGLEHVVDQKYHGMDMDNEFVKRFVLPIQQAKKQFFRHNTTLEDKRAAILEVGRALEYYRPTLKEKFNNKDEQDLFTLLNGYNLRHNRLDQISNYDQELYYPWIFYNLLAAADVFIKMQSR